MTVSRVQTIGRTLFVLAFMAVALPFVYFSGPTVEGLLFPIIKDAARGDASVGADGHVCWDTDMEKVRTGVPAYALYTTLMHGQPVSIFVYLAKGGIPLTQPGFQNHAPGDKWVTRYCTDLPLQMRQRPIRIEGTLYYRVAWRPSWWLVPQPLPTLTIPED